MIMCNIMNVSLFLICTALIIRVTHADVCGRGANRGRPCVQPGFDDYDVPIPKEKLEDEGRLIGGEEIGMNKKRKWKLDLSLWCEAIRPCPVYGGQASASSNATNAAMAFKGGDTVWTSAPMSRLQVSGGRGAWVGFSFEGDARIVGSFLFRSPGDDVINFVFESSQDGVTWQPKQTKEKDGAFKLLHPSVAQHYRLRVTETKWMEAGAAAGTVAVGNIQLCFVDDFNNDADNKYVTSPPIVGGRHFASSRYSRSWGGFHAFQGQSGCWSSEYLSATSGLLDKPQFIGYEFPTPRSARKIAFMGTYQRHYILDHPKVFTFEGSNDGTEWITLLEASVHIRRPNQQVEFLIKRENGRPFKKFRLHVLRTGWSVAGRPGGYVQLRHFRIC